MPLAEWLGPSPWLERMKQLTRDIFKNASLDSAAGKIPSRDVEVVGDLLQVTSRLYWMTGDEDYKTWAFRLADQSLLHSAQYGTIVLGRSEVIGGCPRPVVVSEDPGRRVAQNCLILDRRRPLLDGLFFNAIQEQARFAGPRGYWDTMLPYRRFDRQ
jgi:hypothetical protein